MKREDEKLFSAVKSRDFVEVQTAIDAGANANARDDQGFTPLHWVARWQYSHPTVMEYLLKADADPNLRDEAGRTALH